MKLNYIVLILIEYMLFSTLEKNDLVDVIFPSTCCTKQEIALIKKYLKEQLNLKARILLEDKTTPRLKYDNEFPTYSAELRFMQLYAALENKESKLVWCARGGYGSGDLLPYLAKAKPLLQNKIFIGFSDVVSVTSFLQQKWGWKIMVAPFLLQLAKVEVSKKASQELANLLFGRQSQLSYQLRVLHQPFPSDSILEGEIVGGCLSVLAGHFGGEHQIDFGGKILFLEDEGESGERLDRYFRQIIEVALKTGQFPKALLLGNFCQANLHGSPKAKNICLALELLTHRIKQEKLTIAVFEATNRQLGHSDRMRPLILGSKAVIAQDKTKELSETAYYLTYT